MKFETKFEINDLVDVTDSSDWFHQYNPWRIETISYHSSTGVSYAIRQTVNSVPLFPGRVVRMQEDEIAKHEVKYPTFKEYLLSINLEIEPNTCFYIWKKHDQKEVCISVRPYLWAQGYTAHLRHPKFDELDGCLMSHPLSRLDLPFIGEF